MLTISDRLDNVRSKIKEAEQHYHRIPGTVSLLAVTKGQTIDRIKRTIDCDQHDFGESYLQEAEGKIDKLIGYGLDWHFIGAIQANKTRKIAQIFSWVHSVDRYKIAARLSKQRPSTLAPLNVCLQINVNDEPSKSGTALEQLTELAEQVKQLPNLRLRGLMTIPFATPDPWMQRRSFATVRKALEKLNSLGMNLDTLSMGMSNDMEAAIAEGATIVRIGTAIFGPRESNLKS